MRNSWLLTAVSVDFIQRRVAVAASLALAMADNTENGSHAVAIDALYETLGHNEMVNDVGRSSFYWKALQIAMKACGLDCSVLDIGAGTGLLSMLAASAGAKYVLGVEVNPAVSSWARLNVARNQQRFAHSNIRIIQRFSYDLGVQDLPKKRRADILVSELLGNELLEENVLDFVPDARSRLLRAGGIVIPEGACQYLTLVEYPEFEAMKSPGDTIGLNLSSLDMLRDTTSFKVAVNAPRNSPPFTTLSERRCIADVDFYKDDNTSIPVSKTFRMQVSRSGTIHAAFLDWEIWAGGQVLSMMSGSEGHISSNAWWPILQSVHESDGQWQIAGSIPRPIVVRAGEWLEVGVRYPGTKRKPWKLGIARNNLEISVLIRRVTVALDRELTPPVQTGYSYAVWSAQVKKSLVSAVDFQDANNYYLLLSSNQARNEFYAQILDDAVAQQRAYRSGLDVLDCTGGVGLLALLAAKKYGIRSCAMAFSKGHARVMQRLAKDHGVASLFSTQVWPARVNRQFDIVFVEPPMTILGDLPASFLDPFFTAKGVFSQRVLRASGIIAPMGVCLEIGIVESRDLAGMYAIHADSWDALDFAAWNDALGHSGLLNTVQTVSRLLGQNTSIPMRWLSKPKCIWEVSFNSYGRSESGRRSFTRTMKITSSGRATALVSRYVMKAANGSEGLGPESNRLDIFRSGQASWPQFVKPIMTQGDVAPLRPGDKKRVRVSVSEENVQMELVEDGRERSKMDL